MHPSPDANAPQRSSSVHVPMPVPIIMHDTLPPPPSISILSTEEAAAYAACTMLDTSSATNASEILLSSNDYIQRSTKSLATATLLPQHCILLPNAMGAESWSVAEYILRQTAEAAVPVSFSTVARRMNRLTHQYASTRAENTTVHEAATAAVQHAPEWWHVEGFVAAYRRVMDT